MDDYAGKKQLYFQIEQILQAKHNSNSLSKQKGEKEDTV
jgi:hypothetical protein